MVFICNGGSINYFDMLSHNDDMIEINAFVISEPDHHFWGWFIDLLVNYDQ